MAESPFPLEFPRVGDLLRITPVKEDYVGNYKFFCEEAHVLSRFISISYDGKQNLPSLNFGGRYIKELTFSPKYDTWHTAFDRQVIQVEVEKILE